MNSGAHFSRCRQFRYALWREWNVDQPSVLMIGLNPSTADARRNDPTIRRCIGYARDWGYGGLWMLNLFAYRATYPADLKAATDPIGPRNDEWIRRVARKMQGVVAVWGNDGAFMERSSRVCSMLGNRLEVIRVNAGGEPAHPLYLPNGLKPVKWR
ncbi:MAG: DUF1643 domain-containing protein [Wenzhouxiangellaceae bacterium]|nr:DUF1643 domain-containing protein [Wenzhouxiangellaceae bacterium]